MSYKNYAEVHFSEARLIVRETVQPQKGRMSETNMQRALNRFSEVLRKTDWILKDALGDNISITHSTFKVFEYLFMGAHNRKTGRCNPKNATIAKHTGISEKTVERATSALEKIGLIRKIEHFAECKVTGKKRQRSNYYYLAKGVMKAMYLLLKAKQETQSLFKFFLAKKVAISNKINQAFKTLDQKKHDAQQELFAASGALYDAEFEAYIQTLPPSNIPPKVNPAQEILNKRYGA